MSGPYGKNIQANLRNFSDQSLHIPQNHQGEGAVILVIERPFKEIQIKIMFPIILKLEYLLIKIDGPIKNLCGILLITAKGQDVSQIAEDTRGDKDLIRSSRVNNIK